MYSLVVSILFVPYSSLIGLSLCPFIMLCGLKETVSIDSAVVVWISYNTVHLFSLVTHSLLAHYVRCVRRLALTDASRLASWPFEIVLTD